MKKTFFFLLIISGLVFACQEIVEQTQTSLSISDGAPISFCINDSSELCATLPHEVTTVALLDYVGNLDSVTQMGFDVFSWQSFVGLNWPAGPDGQPLNEQIGTAPDSFRVWEKYPDVATVFDETIAGTTCDTEQGSKKLFLMSKFPQPIDAGGGFQEADGHALIDRNLNFALYDIRLNPVEASYLSDSNLITKAGIANFVVHDTINFPIGSEGGSEGATEVKAAWRILDVSKGDMPDRFYTRLASIYIPGAQTVSGEPLCFEATVGLVALHIARKVTTNVSNVNPWIWSTFEHVDNYPVNADEAQRWKEGDPPYSFYDPKCLNCPLNNPPSNTIDSCLMPPGPGQSLNPVLPDSDKRTVKWDSVAPYAEAYAQCIYAENGQGSLNLKKAGTQVQRTFPIFSSTQYVNEQYRQKLSGTVWENYQLLGTQWRMLPYESQPHTFDIPYLLGNPVQETFMQSTASCASCHGTANVTVSNEHYPSDHSFVFFHAQ